MKKYFTVTSFILCFFIDPSFSQVKEKDIFVDLYYGLPDWQQYILRSNYSGSSNNKNINVTSTGHIGARVEGMVTNRIGFGLDLWYVKTNATVDRSDNVYSYTNYSNNGSNYYPQQYLAGVNKYQINESLSRLTLLGRMIVHIGHSKTIDPYFHAGFGYVGYKHTYTSTYDNNDGNHNNSDSYIPIGARVGFGMRIFFKENFGANIDLGLGGALFTTGLTYKFPSKNE